MSKIWAFDFIYSLFCKGFVGLNNGFTQDYTVGARVYLIMSVEARLGNVRLPLSIRPIFWGDYGTS